MKIFSIIKSIVLWSYERGTWQYDVLSVLILAFIFLTPHNILDERLSGKPNVTIGQRTYVSTAEVQAEVLSSHKYVKEVLTEIVAAKFHRNITVKRVEIDTTDGDQIRGYRVWFE